MAAFEQLGVQPWLSKQCEYMALHNPTPIQQKCIPSILSGKHVVGGAATGSGKTAAFALPILQLLSEDMYGVFAMVLTPSRELAYQIMDQFIALGAPLRVRTMLVIGGVRHEEQVDAAKARPHIMVATPGRLLHLLETFSQEVRKSLMHLRFLVMDEADRLTEGDMRFTVAKVLKKLPPPSARRQTLMFSATLHPRLTTFPPAGQLSAADDKKDDADDEEQQDGSSSIAAEENVLQLLGISDPATLDVVSLSTGADGDINNNSYDGTTDEVPRFPDTLQQNYCFFPNMVKLPHLVAALRSQGKNQSTIVFANSCLRAELVRLTLQLLGFPVCSLNSLLTQQHRLDNLALFKLGIAKVMVATDIAARGLDIPNVGVVIHYDIPKHAPTYVHRVGRTARAGRDGASIAFVTEHDVELVQRIEKKLKIKLSLWKEKAMRESNVLKVLDEVSSAKVQAKQQVTEQFGDRAGTLKEQAAMKRAERAEHMQQTAPRRRLESHSRPSEASNTTKRAASAEHKAEGHHQPLATRKASRTTMTAQPDKKKAVDVTEEATVDNRFFASMEDTRDLPVFDNHYGPETLLGNWHEDRCAAEGEEANRKLASGHRASTASNANGIAATAVATHPAVMLFASTNTPQEYAAAKKVWAATQSTYQEAYNAGTEGVSPAPMLRTPDVERELLLGSGEVEPFNGEATSTAYGKFFADTLASRTRGNTSNSAKTLGEEERREKIKTLYDSNLHVHEGHARPYALQGVCKSTFADTHGTIGEIQRTECTADDNNANRFVTTKRGADMPVGNFFFQRTLPPPTGV